MEEMEVLEYLLSNVLIHQEMLYKLLNKKQVKDEVYNLIKSNIIEYKKYILAIKRMILNRNNKYKFENNILHNIASEIEASGNNSKTDYLLNISESSKISILDIEKIKKEYKIKSKTLLNLLDRMEKFEHKNLEVVSNLIG